MKRCASLLLAGLLVLPASPGLAAPAKAADPILAPGWEHLSFPAPVPGTYALPPLGVAADGLVLDREGEPLQLASLFGDRVVLMAFVYRSCPDPNGCPLANFVLSRVRNELSKDPSLHERARIISLSIDPVRDTPEAMATLGASLAKEPVDWRFLTTATEAALDPILEGWGQSVRRDVDAEGKSLGTLSHILRVFLVDRQRRIRNIYTSSYLHAETVLSDLRTLLMEQGEGRNASAGPSKVLGKVAAPASAQSASLGLPPRQHEELQEDVVALGRKLFFDRRLSFNDTISCGMCHVPAQGFTSNELATSVGIEGRSVRRNAPTLLNVSRMSVLFHDGREDRLEQQVWGPLLARNEMGNPSVGFVLNKIRDLAAYNGLFEAAFGEGPSMRTLGMALAGYQRSLEAADSPFDRWRYGGDDSQFSGAARRGFDLFTGEAGCSGCHLLGPNSALFSDQAFHNTGVGYRQAGLVDAEAPHPLEGDLGRYEITEDPKDRWKYRTPTLRNLKETAPYMHDGSLATIEAVLRFYNEGGVPNAGLDPRIRPLGLGEDQIQDLLAFLEALSSAALPGIVAIAEAEPVGDR